MGPISTVSGQFRQGEVVRVKNWEPGKTLVIKVGPSTGFKGPYEGTQYYADSQLVNQK